MATLKGIYKVLNSSGTYDEINLRTTADQVVESSSKRFVTDTEKTTWNNKANASHTHTSAHITDATNANTANMIVKRDASGNFSAGTITANLSGNASTATTLQNTRTINGTNFNGSGNITTSTWGTARNITIGSSKKSVNGSADIAWSLSEIGAAPASHSHSNYASTSHTHNSLEATDLSNKTVSLNDYNLSSGSPKVAYYICPSDGGGANITGRPNDSTKQAFSLRVEVLRFASTTDYITKQTYIMGAQKIIYVRYCTNGTWTAWEKVYTSAQKPTASEIGAAASSHTHNYAGSSSAGGAANTAVKLHTARTINGVSFDGSANITITANPNAHNQDSSTINAMTGYAKATATSAISTSDSLNTAIGKLERALDDKMATHTHPYRANTWVPSWSEVTSKPTFATVATSGSYNDLSNKPTIHTINDSSTTSTTNTWSAKKINDSLAGKAASSHTHASTQITGLGTAATKNTGTAAGQIPLLDSRGKLSTSILPSVSINNTHTVETVAAALSLTCEVGDIVIVTAYVQPANLEEMIISEDTQRALNSGSNTFICVNATASTFDEKFKVLMSSSDSVTHAEMTSSLNNKVDKVSGKQLSTNDYTTAEKNKLAGIATNANNYVHPSTHAATMITEDSTHRFVTDAEKSTWNGKANASHTHNSIVSRGNVTAESGTTRPAVNGISMSQAYNNSYPTAYGNILNLKGTGDGQILVGWSGTSGAHAPVYVRSKRDNADANWSDWAQIYTTANKPTASDVGALTQSTADSRYRNKTDLVFTDTIQIVTPAT